jgi:dTDP-4-amino-4,6-dideoxygalactose transaminase
MVEWDPDPHSSGSRRPVVMEFLPFHIPSIGQEEIEEVVSALRSGWITTGPRTAQFERDFSEYTGAAHALAVNSCTAALHLSLVGLMIGPGDEVITTPLTFCATANVILETGATPVLVDIGRDLNLDPSKVVRAITSRTKAILVVHLGGLPCDMAAFWGIAKAFNLKIIEDAAHAIGAEYNGRRIGQGESDAVAFSFYATKNMTTGEGGMVTTPSEELLGRMKILCLHGISCDSWNRYTEKGNWHYDVLERGYKYNLSDIQAALGIHQLRKLSQMNARRAEIAARYNAAFDDIQELETPPRDRGHAWHLYMLRLNLGRLKIDRAQFIETMRAEGIGCSVHFIPVPIHTYYRRTLEMRDPCDTAMAEYLRLVSLPLYPRMSDESVDRVIATVKHVIAHSKKSQSVAATV